MTLRSRLSLLVAAALTPMVVFSVVAAVLLQKDERDTMARDGIGRARSAMSAVDAHLRGTLLALQTLAASRTLEAGDLPAFHAEAQRVLRGQPAWVNIGLISAQSEVLFNAVYAFGKPESLPPTDDSIANVAQGAKIGIGNVRGGTAVRSPTVRVHLPVAYGGEFRYVISAPLNLKYLDDLLQAQRLPEGWSIVLVDRKKEVIVALPAAVTGSVVTPGLREAIERSREGWSRASPAEGAASYTAHVTSDLSGWVLAIGIPVDYVERGARRSFAIIAVGALIAFGLGVALAWLVARRIPG
jgi:hypothetical protein